MFNKVERLISSRNLKPKKKEGFLKVISIFSFLGIMLGVAILIIVMSVMNGFRNDLTNKIIGFNPHIVIKPYSSDIDQSFKLKLKREYQFFKITETFGGEAVVVNNNLVKGVFVKGINKKSENIKSIENNLIDGNLQDFEVGKIILGKQLAINLGVVVGDSINLMSSAFISTPMGGLPMQESFEIVAVFSSGFYEFDQGVVFLNLNDSLSFFDKTEKDLNLEIKLDDPLKADFYKKKNRSD